MATRLPNPASVEEWDMFQERNILASAPTKTGILTSKLYFVYVQGSCLRVHNVSAAPLGDQCRPWPEFNNPPVIDAIPNDPTRGQLPRGIERIDDGGHIIVQTDS
jgi:hypothetical protein